MTTSLPTPQRLQIAIAAAGSAGLLLGALAFQYLGGLAPCQLCIWQRWPHLAAVLIGVVAVTFGARGLAVLGGLAALTSAGIGVFHVGVEQGWWAGLQSCTAGSISGISASDLLNPAVDVAQVVRCDAIAWSLMGISMAGWNVIASVILAAIWFTAARR
ncbi:disulfide bond formation protein B [Gemmobacter caeruleus]|uniref:disulfide bond formation protein B n=1 Tax=Gemmobacter caeruleus TaxID=2595004 RepID=UPI001EF1006F|nr:disulfide bond formation protein B [Gemmobacter caeruleus]